MGERKTGLLNLERLWKCMNLVGNWKARSLHCTSLCSHSQIEERRCKLISREQNFQVCSCGH